MIGFAEASASLFFIAALAAALGAAAACACGPADVPVARSIHTVTRPRVGGLGVLLGVGAAALALALGAAPALMWALGPDADSLVLVLLAATMGGAVGLLDDLSIIGLRTKFLGILAVSLAAAAAGPVRVFDAAPDLAITLPFAVALAGSAFWVFVVANATNFMDGVDGMLAAGLGASALGLAVLGAVFGAPLAAVCGLLLAGGLLGFSPFNVANARVFAGDSGALFAGVLFAAGALDFARHGPPGAAWTAPLLVAPFFADVFATLLARALAGAPLWQAHREHLYQRLAARGWPHWKVSFVYGVATLACAALAGAALAIGPTAALAALAVLAPGGLALAWVLRGRLQ